MVVGEFTFHKCVPVKLTADKPFESYGHRKMKHFLLGPWAIFPGANLLFALGSLYVNGIPIASMYAIMYICT